MNSRPLALTPGEPAGIGPDLTVQIAQKSWSRAIVAIADPAMLEARAKRLGLPLRLLPYTPEVQAPAPAGCLYIHAISAAAPATPGQLNERNAAYLIETLRQAAQGCCNGDYAGMVTAPVHKGIINRAGITFSGHTEFIAQISGGHPVMMLACPGLRIALATTHLPLREVADAITPQVLEQVLLALHKDLQQRFDIAEPKILVCGLNPHAGEDGYLGREEIEVINPTLERLRRQGLNLSPALPADTLFTEKYLKNADAVLAMYHDQGLPVLKHKGFGESVNITLGLPIVRTSVDHGTALDLAGSGKASACSLRAAIEQAIVMSGGKEPATR